MTDVATDDVQETVKTLDTAFGLCQCGCGTRTGLYTKTMSGHVRGQPRKYLAGHHMKLKDPWVINAETGCWLWQGFIDPGGYGTRGHRGGKSSMAHRRVYEERKGAIPFGLQLDHLCKVRHCVNPDHMEPVTPKINTLRSEGITALSSRKTHCKQGHSLPPELQFNVSQGFHRRCKVCQKEQQKRWWANGGYERAKKSRISRRESERIAR